MMWVMAADFGEVWLASPGAGANKMIIGAERVEGWKGESFNLVVELEPKK
jgi:hypothetical protein